MPTNQDFTIWRGNTFDRAFRFKDNQGALTDLTGVTLTFTASGSNYNLSKALAIPTPTNGEANLSLSAVETRSIPLGRLTNYELESEYLVEILAKDLKALGVN